MNVLHKGFTLIEVIITVVLSALALAAVVPLLGQVFMRSHEPCEQLVIGAALHSAMENLVALHDADDAVDLAVLHTAVGAEGASYAGDLTVIHNRYVSFSGGAEHHSSVTNNLLKVTLGNSLGEQLSRLFAEVEL